MHRSVIGILCAALAVYSTLAGAGTPLHYTVEVTDRKPLSREHFVQGLEIVGDKLYLSSGLYRRSKLLRYDFTSGTLEAEQKLDDHQFAEGLTVLNGRVYQLTWRNRLGLIYDEHSLKLVARWRLPGEGWGLTNNGKELIYSDGSDRLHFIAPEDGRRLRSLRVVENNRRVRYLNELEWIDGRIWANIWGSDRIVIIDPATGAVTATVDLTGLLPTPERRADTDVLNGIARDPATGNIWVTGKRWPWLYQIELRGAPGAGATTSAGDSR